VSRADGFRGKRVLITGGAGLVGSHIADLLVRDGVAQIVVVDSLVRGRRDHLRWALEHGPVTLVEGDIRDHGLMSRLLQGIDVVFHQAALRITQCAEEPRLALEVLVQGTFNVLEAAVAARVAKVVMASSASVYGMAERFPTPEAHHPYHNRTLYGAAKAFGEGMLAAYRDTHGLDYVALRYFNVYGPRMDTRGAYTEVLIRWMERIAAGSPPIVFGQGDQTIDFVYVEDVARANLLAALAPASGEAFNVGSGVETSLTQLAQLLQAAMGADVGIEHAPERRVNPVRRRLADTSRARAELGFEARVELPDGLRRLVAWWRQAADAEGVSRAAR
jgi:UDP-glucose 4-epimerase